MAWEFMANGEKRVSAPGTGATITWSTRRGPRRRGRWGGRRRRGRPAPPPPGPGDLCRNAAEAWVHLPNFLVGKAGQFRQGEFVKPEAARKIVSILVREGRLATQEIQDADERRATSAGMKRREVWVRGFMYHTSEKKSGWCPMVPGRKEILPFALGQSTGAHHSSSHFPKSAISHLLLYGDPPGKEIPCSRASRQQGGTITQPFPGLRNLSVQGSRHERTRAILLTCCCLAIRSKRHPHGRQFRSLFREKCAV